MYYDMLCKASKSEITVGAKETLKALRKNKVEAVFIARDAEERIIAPIRKACQEKSIYIEEIDTMKNLGKACGVAVGSSTAALLKK